MYNKRGEISVNRIIESCIETFNAKGLDITLNQLAIELNISRGRINHYFPTKDLLLVAIARKYEEELAAIRDTFKYSTEENFLFDQIKLYALIMDNQYRFRCVTIYASGTSSSRNEMIQQINNQFKGTKERFLALTERLIALGYLKSEALEVNNLEVFRFKFVTMFTSWVIHHEIYDKDKSYEEVKPIYLKAIASCFLDFALPKTIAQLDAIDFTSF